MKYVIIYLITFCVIYLLYFLLVVNRKKAINKFKNSMEVKYLMNKYSVNIDKVNIKKLANMVALSNSFIITTVFIVIIFIDNFILKLLVAFVILFPLIIIIYWLLGKILKKEEGK